MKPRRTPSSRTPRVPFTLRPTCWAKRRPTRSSIKSQSAFSCRAEDREEIAGTYLSGSKNVCPASARAARHRSRPGSGVLRRVRPPRTGCVRAHPRGGRPAGGWRCGALEGALSRCRTKCLLKFLSAGLNRSWRGDAVIANHSRSATLTPLPSQN
jgi:hypothetical protein